MRRFFSGAVSLLLASATVLCCSLSSFAVKTMDNSELVLEQYNKEHSLKPSYCEEYIYTPDWVDSLIIVELRPDTASIGGTFAESYDLIDFYAQTGVNGIWLSPVYDRAGGNGYSNAGPHTIDPSLTGKDNYEDGWKELKKFVDYAHSKGIYIFLDVITWGVVRGAPIISEHPDWFNGEAWGNIAFDWSNTELREWYVKTLTDNILKTGADGYRCDCEPYHSGYTMYSEVRNILHEKGKDIIVICEDFSERKGCYDFEQDGIMSFETHGRADLYQNPVNFFADGYLSVVDSAKKGKGIGYPDWQNSLKAGSGRYYTCCITNHDFQKRNVLGNRIKIGYSAVFAPYIPIWYMGDEFNAFNESGVLYDLPVDYSERFSEENSGFLEDVRKMINIRRTYSDIFEYWPSNHRHSNICAVETTGFGSLEAYARFRNNRAALIVPNNSQTAEGKITVPFAKCGLRWYGKYTVTDLMIGEVVKEGTAEEISTFSADIQENHVGVFLVEGSEPQKPLLIYLSLFIIDLPETVSSFFLNLFAGKI